MDNFATRGVLPPQKDKAKGRLAHKETVAVKKEPKTSLPPKKKPAGKRKPVKTPKPPVFLSIFVCVGFRHTSCVKFDTPVTN